MVVEPWRAKCPSSLSEQRTRALGVYNFDLLTIHIQATGMT